MSAVPNSSDFIILMSFLLEARIYNRWSHSILSYAVRGLPAAFFYLLQFI
jgi:hypothetical protein